MKQFFISLAGLFFFSSPLLAAGDHLWSHGFGGPTSSDNVIVWAAATDTIGNVVITGEMEHIVNFGGSDLTSAGVKDIFVAKFNSSGVHQWSVRFGSTGTDVGFGIGTDSSGNVYVVGNIGGAVDFGGGAVAYAGGSDIFTLKLSSAGAYVWANSYGGTGNEGGNSIGVMADGTFVITGYFGVFGNGQTNFGGGIRTTVGQDDLYVAKFTSAGAYTWDVEVGGTGHEVGNSIAVNASGTIAVTGYFTSASISMGCPGTLVNIGSTTTKDSFLLDYNSAGVLTWVRRFGGTSDDVAYAVAISSIGEIVVTGNFNATADFGGGGHTSTGAADFFLVKYSAGGSWTWDRVFGDSSGFEGASRSVAIDTSGNITMAGFMLSNLNFGGGPLCSPSCGTYDVFFAKFTSTGAPVVSQRFETTAYDEHAYTVTTDSGGNIFLGGEFLDQEDFGGGPLTPNGLSQGLTGFLAKFSP